LFRSHPGVDTAQTSGPGPADRAPTTAGCSRYPRRLLLPPVLVLGAALAARRSNRLLLTGLLAVVRLDRCGLRGGGSRSGEAATAATQQLPQLQQVRLEIGRASCRERG